MFSFSLLFALIGCVLSSEYPSADGTTLLGMIRKDPNALLSIFDTADKNKVDTIIQLLNNLIGEGNAEIDDINDGIVACNYKVSNATEDYDNAVGNEKTFYAAHQEAKKLESKANGRLMEAKTIYDRESPALKKEITVFLKVTRILNTLLTRQEPKKSLAEEHTAEEDLPEEDAAEQDTAEIRAFISLADQADPVKVKKVIALVEKLLLASRKELLDLSKALKSAEEAYEAARVATRKAYVKWVGGQAAVVGAKKIRDTLVGECATNLKNGNARKVVVNEELKTLRHVIALLKGVTK